MICIVFPAPFPQSGWKAIGCPVLFDQHVEWASSVSWHGLKVFSHLSQLHSPSKHFTSSVHISNFQNEIGMQGKVNQYEVTSKVQCKGLPVLMGECTGRQLSAAGNIPFQRNEGSSRVAGVLPESSELVC
ncbi:hypothetical protein E2C01_008737 [Portunus trituberculatus]|uniref:Uncharacterized protein n=1 Tax=Portunus trituberculatus TaxID=210409 RepID=A0A5B7D1K5_PORTR|nr:hypothetical protein [Portunus trituberculatus]